MSVGWPGSIQRGSSPRCGSPPKPKKSTETCATRGATSSPTAAGPDSQPSSPEARATRKPQRTSSPIVAEITRPDGQGNPCGRPVAVLDCPPLCSGPAPEPHPRRRYPSLRSADKAQFNPPMDGGHCKSLRWAPAGFTFPQARRAIDGPASFVPEVQARRVRDLARARDDVIADRNRVEQRVEKIIENALVEISAVLIDQHGVSGRAMVEARVQPARPLFRHLHEAHRPTAPHRSPRPSARRPRPPGHLVDLELHTRGRCPTRHRRG